MESSNYVFALIVHFNPILIALIIYIFNITFYNSKQEELIQKIEGNKRFIREFTRLKHRPIDYINFVRYYYVLAEAYGIKITDQDYFEAMYDDNSIETLTSAEFSKAVFKEIGEAMLRGRRGFFR